MEFNKCLKKVLPKHTSSQTQHIYPNDLVSQGIKPLVT